MKTRYRILWIDDKVKQGFIDLANFHGFDIEHHRNSDAGMEYLRSNLTLVDGIILDAQVYKNAQDEADDNDHLGGLQASLKEIVRIETLHSRCFPRAIYSGQAGFLSNDGVKEFFEDDQIFNKKGDDDYVFEYLRDEIDRNPTSQLKANYSELYKAVNSEWFEEDLWERFLNLLDVVHNGAVVDQGEKLNSIRRILERICGALSKGGVIPEVLVSDVATLRLSSLFIGGGNRNQIELKKERKVIDIISNPFPKAIAEQVRLVMDFTGIGSHEELNPVDASQKFSIASYNSSVPTNYLLHSVTFMVADIVLWTVAHLSENSDVDTNKKRWCLRGENTVTAVVSEGTSVQIGVVKTIIASGAGFFTPDEGSGSPIEPYIPPGLVDEHKLIGGIRLKVSSSPAKSGKRQVDEILEIL